MSCFERWVWCGVPGATARSLGKDPAEAGAAGQAGTWHLPLYRSAGVGAWAGTLPCSPCHGLLAMECGKVHGLGELLEERGEGDCRHFRGGSAAISANSGEALYRPGKSRIRVDSVNCVK